MWMVEGRFIQGLRRVVGLAWLALCAVALLCGCGRIAAPDAVREADTFYGTSTRLRSMDPVQAGDVSSILAVARVYEGLYRYDYSARPYRLIPQLAEGMPEVSGDGCAYTIRLREGMRFQNDPCFTNTGGKGRALTAEDVLYSIKRVADVKTGSSGYWAFRGKILGLDAFREQSTSSEPTDYDAPVEGLRLLDERTLQIRMAQPYPQLLWILAMPYAFAVPREAVHYYGDEFRSHPVGSGPYRLISWVRNYRLEYAANPDWRPAPGIAAQVEGRPQRLVYYVMDDSSTRWLAFLSGQLDLYADIARDNWDVIFAEDGSINPMLKERGIRDHRISGLNVYYIGFNMSDPVLGGNKPLRQALSCAFNSRDWVGFYRNRIMRATGPIPPGVAGYVEETPYPFDLERARALLVEAGYPEGIDPATGQRLILTLELGATDSEMRESTELFVAFMDQLGVVVQPSYNNKPALFKKVEKRQAQMFRLSWFADYPDGQNFLQLFYGPNESPGPNRVNYNNKAFDRLYRRIAVMQDSPERTALYEEMGRIIMEDCPWIFMHYPVDYSLSRQRLEGYLPHDFPYGMECFYRLTGP